MRNPLRFTEAALAGLALALAACGPAASPDSDGPPPVFVNHFSLVLDQDTYQAVVSSEFLNSQLAAVQVNRVSDGEREWTGAYVFGETVYLEFFAEDAGLRRLAGGSAIAFGVETPGGADQLFNRIVPRINEHIRHRLRMRQIGERQVPWFFETAIDYQDPQAVLATWIMEYHPDYLKARYPDLRPGEEGITRRKYLARNYDPSRLLKSVSEAVLALSPLESERLVAEVEVFGWPVERDKLEIRCRGSETLLRIVPETESARGLVSLTLTLNRPAPAGELRFGERSALSFDGGDTAQWSF